MAKKIIELNVEEILATTGEAEVTLGSLGYSGVIKLEKPSIVEGLNAQELTMDLAESKAMKGVIALIQWSKPFYKEVNISFEDYVYTSLEDIMDDNSMLAFATAIAMQLIKGLPRKK